MKFLTVFVALLAVACGARSHWTLEQLSEALQNPTTNPSLVPLLEQALNTFMTSMFAGESHEVISITTAPVDLHTWTLSELSEAVENPNTNPALLPYLENALNALMTAIFSGQVQAATASAAITIPAMEISYWTLAEVDQALMDPTTSPALIPYLEQALNQMMQNLFNGVEGAASIVLATPVEATPAIVEPEVVLGPGFEVTPVDVVDSPIRPPAVVMPPVAPVIVAPVAVESAPEAVAAPAVSGSPLVQIILNINQKESAAAVPEVAPEAVITPIDTAPFPNNRPDAPEIVPEVVIAPDFNPIDDIMISPPEIQPMPVLVDVGPM